MLSRCCALSTALLIVKLLAVIPPAGALRRLTPADSKKDYGLWTRPKEPALTSYGQPVGQLLTRNTSVDHFGSVCAWSTWSVCFEGKSAQLGQTYSEAVSATPTSCRLNTRMSITLK